MEQEIEDFPKTLPLPEEVKEEPVPEAEAAQD